MHKSLRLGKLLVIPYDSHSNYINLPSNILGKISKMKTQHLPYHFELKTSYDLVFYVGVKEFTAQDGCIEVPTWISEYLADDYLMVTFLKDIPKGEYIKIQPQSKTFFDIPEYDKILEASLSNYCLLNLNQIIEVSLLDVVYKIKILECKTKLDSPNEELIEITNVDLKVDIDNMFLEKQQQVVNKEEVVHKEDNLQIDDNYIFNKDDQMIPESKQDNIGEKLGGNNIDKEELRKARLKFYSNKTV